MNGYVSRELQTKTMFMCVQITHVWCMCNQKNWCGSKIPNVNLYGNQNSKCTWTSKLIDETESKLETVVGDYAAHVGNSRNLVSKFNFKFSVAHKWRAQTKFVHHLDMLPTYKHSYKTIYRIICRYSIPTAFIVHFHLMGYTREIGMPHAYRGNS